MALMNNLTYPMKESMIVPYRTWWVISKVLGNSSPRSKFKHDKLFLVRSGFPDFVFALGSLVAIQYGCSSRYGLWMQFLNI